jgi:septal ring factor EnvC (AmiA/AmiB activator)
LAHRAGPVSCNKCSSIAMIRIYFIFLFSPLLVWGQSTFSEDILSNRQALEQIKSRIDSLKNEITKTEIKSSSLLDQINIIDRQVVLINQSRQLLKNEAVLLQQKIAENQSRLRERKDKLQQLRDQYAHQVLYNYKHGKLKDLEILLTAASFNQLMVRYKYMQIIATQEKIQVSNINNQIMQINQLEQTLTLDLRQLNLTLKEKEEQQKNYLLKKEEKRSLIARLKWTSTNLQQRLHQAQYEYERLQNIIATLEKDRNLRERQGQLSSDYARLNPRNFASNKGKFPWPVKGRILHTYGRQRDIKLNTIVNNTGIDIQAKTGTEVHAVYTGIVVMITYLSGYGNTIIIDHGEGYYTVYSHLDEIYVEKDRLVETGSIIASVGDSGSLEGSMLHFAVFVNQQVEDPESWLK